MQTIIIILLLVTLLGLSFQDFKTRQISLWLVVLSGLFLGYLHYTSVGSIQFLFGIAQNFLIISLLILILVLYTKYVLRKTFSSSMGLGDILFFIVFALGFPTVTFLVLFVFSIFFSGVLFLVLKKHITETQIPLAGFQSLFLLLIMLIYLIIPVTNLYKI